MEDPEGLAAKAGFAAKVDFDGWVKQGLAYAVSLPPKQLWRGQKERVT